MKKRLIYLLWAALVTLPFNFAQAASSLLVWPIFQVIESDQNGSALWLENRGSQPVRIQVRVLAWQQTAMRDQYADQNDVVASPPFTTIPPQQRQLIRLMRTSAPPARGEKAYRIILDEIPSPNAAPVKNGAGLRLQMRYVLPLFLDAEGVWTQERTDKRRNKSDATQPQLHWSLVNEQGKTWLRIRNQGRVHARLTNVFWARQPDASKALLVMAKGYMGYVLAGQTMQFPLPRGQAVISGATLYAQLEDNGPIVAVPQ